MTKKLVSLWLVLMFLVGCAELQMPQTADDRFLAASIQYNKMLVSYMTHRDALPEVEREELNKTFKPIFLEAAAALEVWELAIDEGADPMAKEEAYLKLKNRLIDLLAEVL